MCPLFQRVFSNLRHAPAYGELDDAKISLENEKRSLLKRGAHRVVDKKYASSFSLSHCKYKSYEAVDSIFSKKTKAAKISFDENGNETRKHLCSPSVGNSQNWSKDRRVRRTNENLVLAAYNSIEKRDEMTTRKAVFGVTVTGEASFRYHS